MICILIDSAASSSFVNVNYYVGWYIYAVNVYASVIDDPKYANTFVRFVQLPNLENFIAASLVTSFLTNVVLPLFISPGV